MEKASLHILRANIILIGECIHSHIHRFIEREHLGRDDTLLAVAANPTSRLRLGRRVHSASSWVTGGSSGISAPLLKPLAAISTDNNRHPYPRESALCPGGSLYNTGPRRGYKVSRAPAEVGKAKLILMPACRKGQTRNSF